MARLPKQSQIFLDAWSPYDYKENFLAGPSNEGRSWLAPTWVGHHRRRLQAYALLQAYVDNTQRSFIEVLGTSVEDREKSFDAKARRREYGDARLLVETARAAVMGDQQTIVVEDADKLEDAEGLDKTAAQAAVDRQEELRQWARDERLTAKIIENERNATTLGDAVFSIPWDGKRKRARWTPWDPATYFPVLEGVAPGDFPTRVHLAWELTEDEAEAKYGERILVIHRITFELIEGEPYALPWDPAATQRCYMWEAEYKTWEGVRTPDDLSDEFAIWMLDDERNEIREKDLGIDFIPVVHVPNTVAELEHYGRSILSNVSQIIDDIQSVDSDAQFSSDLTGNPILVVKGAVASKLGVEPGTVISVSKDGDAYFLAASEFVKALREQANDLRQLLAENSRVTSAAQGRVDPTKIAAGIILQLTFGPLKSFVEEMRLTREDKYGLGLKFVQRYMVLNGVWQGDVLNANIAFGSFLPNDVTGVINECATAVQAGIMSIETAIRRMIEVGVPVDDIAEEIRRIQARDFEGASQMLDATGNDKAVGDYLGVKVEHPDPVEMAREMAEATAPPDDTGNKPPPPDNAR